MRVVSLCPSNTEIMEFLGLAEMLIGVDDFSDWPASIEKLPRLGPDLAIDMDRVEQLRPDLVLASLSVPGMERNVYEMQRRSIPHLVLNPQSLKEIEADLLKTAEALGQQQRGLEAATAFRKQIASLRELGKKVKNRPSLYWEWWPKPVFTPGKINWLTEISELAGAYNIFADVDLASVQTDWDDVLNRDPDYICLAWVGVHKKKVNPDLVKKRPGWDQLNAVINNRILVLEEELFCRPSPRLIEGAEKLAKLLHPAAFIKS